MTEILHSVSFASAGAASALLSAVWEGAALVLAVYLGLRLLPGLSAAARSVIWLNVFVLLVLLHFVPAFAPAVAEVTGSRAPIVHLDPRWSLGIAGAWLALSVWRALQLLIGLIHLRRLARGATPVAVDAHLEALLAKASGGRAAQLCTSHEVIRPSVLGFLRPRVLLPAALVEHLTPQELEQVVLHEVEHLRRGDDWTNLLQKIGLVLFPLNPVLLWVERRLCAERELACDDRVMQSSAGRKAYALCLARLAEISLFRKGFSLVLGLWERRPDLVRRVQRIVSQPVRSMGRRPAIAATGSLLAGALGCAIALSHSPQLVSFSPAYRPLSAASFDPHEVAKVLGGTPQLMKAAMPGPSPHAASERESRKPVHHAVLKAAHRPRSAASQIARGDGDPGQSPLPTLDQRAVLVLTEVTVFQAPRPRAVLAVAPDRQFARPAAIRATYAIVPTPSGWLIIQI
jgi:beta-lactamase regulating signal transducer with metallopeptidase domain